MKLNFYCGKCEQLVCHYCIMTEHNGHERNTMKRVARKHRTEMDGFIQPVEDMINGLAIELIETSLSLERAFRCRPLQRLINK